MQPCQPRSISNFHLHPLVAALSRTSRAPHHPVFVATMSVGVLLCSASHPHRRWCPLGVSPLMLAGTPGFQVFAPAMPINVHCFSDTTIDAPACECMVFIISVIWYCAVIDNMGVTRLVKSLAAHLLEWSWGPSDTIVPPVGAPGSM